MRINEDYIDSIEVDDISSEVEATDDNFNDKDMYRFAFFFRTREVDITYVTEDGWKSIADDFYRKLYEILDASPIITEYRHNFPLYVGIGWFGQIARNEVVKKITTDNGREVLFYDRNNPTRGRQPLAFLLQFDANIRTLEKLRLLIIFLWRSFQVLSKKTFLPEPLNIELESVGGGSQDRPSINDNNYQIWLRKASNEISRMRYKTFIRGIHPELRGKQLNDMVDEFLKDNTDTDIAELVNRMHKETKGVSYRLIDKALQNVRLEGDTLVITKDKFTACCHVDTENLMNTTVKFRVEGVKMLEYGIGEYGVIQSMDSVRADLKWLSEHFTGDWTAKIYVSRPSFYGQFSDRKVDLRTVTDHQVKFKKPGQYQMTIYTSEIKFPIRNQTSLDFEVTDSFRTHIVELEVKKPYSWMDAYK